VTGEQIAGARQFGHARNQRRVIAPSGSTSATACSPNWQAEARDGDTPHQVQPGHAFFRRLQLADFPRQLPGLPGSLVDSWKNH
jgi:hypothetical protein